MKKKFKIIFIIGVVFAAIFVVLNILLGVFAPRVIESQVQQNLKLKTSLRKVSLALPLTVVLEGLELGDLATVKKISLSLNPLGLFFGKIVIHGLTIVDPVVNLVQSADGRLNLPVLEQKGKPPAVYLTGLKIENGKVIFTDHKVASAGFQMIVNKLNISVSKVTLPVTSLSVDFKLSAELVNAQNNAFGTINFGGWLDYLTKSMDAKLEVNRLDITNFSAYYGNFISNRKLTSAILDLSSTFKAKNNALEILTEFDLSKIIYAANQPEQLADLDLVKNALDFFIDADGNLKLEFKVDTALDNPSLSPQKLKSIILKAAAKNLSRQSPQQLADKVANTINKYKDFGKELKQIFGN